MIDVLNFTYSIRKPSVLRRLIAGIETFIQAEADRRRRNYAAAQLQAVSDHGLKDLGLHRSEIGSLVCGSGLDERRRGYAHD